MEQASLIIGDGNWAVKSGSLLGYTMFNEQFYPQDITASRATTATRVDENGLIVTSSVDIARIDYSTGEAALLVEPQRTNLLLRSEEFDNVYWTKTGGTLNSNVINSPSGTLTADEFLQTASNANITRNVIVSAGATHTFSFFIKKIEGEWVRIAIFNSAFTEFVNVWFNISTKQKGIFSKSVLSTYVMHNITNFQNDWVRLDVTFAIPIDTNINVNLQLVNADNSTTRLLPASFYLWGAQLEAGAYATSYIPTTSASVTRNADVISKTGIADLVGQTEGTLFVDFNLSTIGTDNGSGIVELSPSGGVGGESNRVIIFKNLSSKQIGFQIRAGGATNIFNSIFSAPPDGQVKAGIAYKSGDTILSVNGSIVARSETFNFSQTLNFIKLGSYSPSNFSINDTINQVLLFKTRLSNAELQQLTTL
jgi:hypothetical protein